MKLLRKPHPFIFNGYSVLVPTVISFLILTILRPFNFSEYTLNELLVSSTLLSALVGIIVLVVGGSAARILRRDSLERWTVGKEILLIISVLAVICILIFGFFLSQNPEVQWVELFMIVVARTLALSIMPIIVMVLFEQHRYQAEKRKQAEQINAQLLKRELSTQGSPERSNKMQKLQLNSENQKVALSVFPKDLLCIRSDGNYLEVFHLLNNQVRMDLIRNSLKSIADQLPSSSFFRCHQRFIVNLNHIRKVDGNARNLLLIVEGMNEGIPVSRSKSKLMLDKFQLRDTKDN